MVYKKIKDNQGDYIDGQQTRWDILEAHEAWTPQGKNVGWDEFESKEEAAAAYGLTYNPIPEPEPDNPEEID